MLALEKGYYITAELKVKHPTKVQEAKLALQSLCEQTMKESGCSLFCLHQCTEDATRFVLWERFEDEDAFKQHFLEAHTKTFVQQDLTEIVRYFQTDIV